LSQPQIWVEDMLAQTAAQNVSGFDRSIGENHGHQCVGSGLAIEPIQGKSLRLNPLQII